ncbi:hypothetical protein [Methylobacterium sp. 17Sr1-1]|uniref:hypothetical protein n=1 Tax=Methylobacterium sp. 17Sr1-1 TaxID=2202826 RepID=UPI0013A55479|nr:hypothetical protein [Methylobacterium sp. 17Sr1-1]
MRTPLGLAATYVAQINTMAAHFDKMRVVESLPGPGDDAVPTVMEVQDLTVPARHPAAEAERHPRPGGGRPARHRQGAPPAAAPAAPEGFLF